MGLWLRRVMLRYPRTGVAGFAWNRWQASTGISGNLRPEYAVNQGYRYFLHVENGYRQVGGERLRVISILASAWAPVSGGRFPCVLGPAPWRHPVAPPAAVCCRLLACGSSARRLTATWDEFRLRPWRENPVSRRKQMRAFLRRGE